MTEIRDARVAILVKAFPQPSQTYQETVCVAGVDLNTGALIRLYPVPYRTLKPEQQFDRYDCIKGRIFRATGDPRPESFKIEPESIQIVSKGTETAAEAKTRLWATCVSPSLDALERLNVEKEVSLGIIAPDLGSLRLRATPIAEDMEQARLMAYEGAKQQSIFEQSEVKPLMPEFVFRYAYRSNGTEHLMQIIDWEVQAAWSKYKRKYGVDAMSKLREAYVDTMAQQNVHFVLGTTREHLRNFTIIGLLRTQIPPTDVLKQGNFSF